MFIQPGNLKEVQVENSLRWESKAHWRKSNMTNPIQVETLLETDRNITRIGFGFLHEFKFIFGIKRIWRISRRNSHRATKIRAHICTLEKQAQTYCNVASRINGIKAFEMLHIFVWHEIIVPMFRPYGFVHHHHHYHLSFSLYHMLQLAQWAMGARTRKQN